MACDALNDSTRRQRDGDGRHASLTPVHSRLEIRAERGVLGEPYARRNRPDIMGGSRRSREARVQPDTLFRGDPGAGLNGEPMASHGRGRVAKAQGRRGPSIDTGKLIPLVGALAEDLKALTERKSLARSNGRRSRVWVRPSAALLRYETEAWLVACPDR